MAKHIALLTAIGVFAVSPACLAYPRIQNCNGDHIDVFEQGTFQIFCNEIEEEENMSWSIIHTNGTEELIATCGPYSCQDYLSHSFRAYRPTTTTARLEIERNHRSWAGATVKCMTDDDDVALCPLRIIKPGTVKNCTISTNVLTLLTSGSCRVDNMFASDSIYSCWLENILSNGNTQGAGFSILSQCGNGDVCSTCDFFFPTALVEGKHTFRVSVSTGTVKPYFINIEIQSPGTPSVTECPTYAKEHQNLICYCKPNSEKPGKPLPMLFWLTVPTTSALRINNISRVQDRESHVCVQKWGWTMTTVLYQVHVAYGPTSAAISGPEYVITTGLMPLRLMCTTDNVSPSVKYTWSGATCINDTQVLSANTCTFIPTLTDARISVTCTAENRKFNTLSATATKVINIKYPPTLPPVITGYEEGRILTEGESLQLNCTVFGGNPLVASVSLFCNNQQISSETVVTDNRSSTAVSTTIREVVFRNGSVCICAANWKPESSLYNVKTSIRLTIAAAEIPRVKSVSLNDVYENLTVNASDNTRVILSCAASGRPKPSIRVVRVDTGQPLEINTSHTSSQDENVHQYTLTTSARCQDAAIYRCQANNSDGTDQRNVTLFVQCSPRLAPEDQSLGSAAKPFIISDAEISIVAFPVPSVKQVVFLDTASGETNPSTDSGQSSTALIADCQPDALLLYIARCSVSVKNEATAENGIYRLTLNNAVGSVDVYLKLDLTEEGSLEQSQGVPTVAIAGGVAAAVVVIIVIATVVVIFLRRKKLSQRHKGHNTNADDEGFEEHINAVYGMEDTSEEDPKEKPKPPIKPTAVAWRISADKRETDTLQEEEINAGYSSVSTGRNQQPTIMPSRDNLNGDESVESDEDGTYSSVDDGSRMVHADRAIQPQLSSQGAGDYATTGAEGEQGRAEGPRGDVYAVVDKTKKKQQSSDHTSPSVGAENSGTARRGPASDVYAVVDKTKKRGPTSNNTGSSPAVSAQSPSTGIIGPGGDVYAQVNKSSGRDKARGDTAQQVQGTRQPGTGNNTSQKPTVKPKPAAKPKPALRPKPSTTPAGDTANDGRDASGIGTAVERDPYEDVGLSSSPESPSSTSDAQNITTTQTTETDDEYNTLRFEDNRPLRRAEAGDAEYSHIGFI